MDLDGRKRRVVAPADLILLELIAWRAKDQLDIQNVLAVQASPTKLTLRAAARELGVEGRLDAALTAWRQGPT